MKVAACALNQTPLDWKGNTRRILQAVEQAKQQQADLVLLPELCLSGYGCEDYFLMPWLFERAMEILQFEILPASQGILLAIGFPLRMNHTSYNSLAILADGKLHGFYLKQILATQGVFYENRWFHPWPGNKVTEHPELPGVLAGDFTIQWKNQRIGFEICEDAWHPEDRPAITGEARNASLILNASASNFSRGKSADRHRIVQGLEGRSNAWYIYTNLLGNESGHLIFDGEIMLGKAGKILYSSPLLSMEEVQVRVFDLEENRNWPGTHPADSDFETFTAAVCLGLKDYLRKSGSKGFTLSLSGGADSAACAVLVAEMLRRGQQALGEAELSRQLGFEADMNNLLCCIYQASRHSGPVTRKAAEELAKTIGAEFHCWEIAPLVDEFCSLAESSLKEKLSWDKHDLALQNIQARSRAPGVWMMANLRNHLLLTTGNRSEADVGYCTMDGDTAGSLAPIAGVSKHFIRQWLVWARDNLQLPVLDLIIQQEPTAELRPGKQTDEGDLMPYELMEQIELLFLREKCAPQDIPERLATFRKEDIKYLQACTDKFLLLWKRNQWKRERLAPSFHLDSFNVIPRSMGRFPIFSG